MSLLALALAATLAGSAPAGAESAADEAFPGWRVFAAREDGFRVEFPADPTRRETSRLSALGRVRNCTWTASGLGLQLAVERHDIPEIAASLLSERTILDRVARGVVEDVRGELLEARSALVAERAGRALRYRVAGDLVEEARLLLQGSKVYVVTARSLGSAAGAANALRFFESFALSE